MSGAKRPQPGLPSRQQILDFIASSADPAGKREIARAFGLKGQEKIQLKALLKDMAEEGLIDGNRTAFHRVGGVAKVTVLRVIDTDDGEAVAIPDSWNPDDATPPPRLRLREKGKGTALRSGDRVLARTEETATGWIAHPMKKLPNQADQVLGVVEIDRSGKGWLAPVDKRVRNSSPIADLGGAEEGQLVLAEPAGRSPRSGVKVTAVLGDPLAPKAFSLIAIHKHGIPFAFDPETLAEGEVAARLPLSPDHREDLRHLPIVAIDPSDARDHDDAIWAEPDGQGGFRALVAIADVSFYVRPGSKLDREARRRGNSVYFPDRVVPMLPEVLSADVCSLRAGEDRAAMACHMQISAEGKVSDWRFTRALVRIHEVIAYEEAQRRIDADEAADNLSNLWDAWRALEKARDARDPLALELPERRVVLDEQGKIKEIALRERLDAHRVVEDFMIAANVAAAKALEAKVSPVVYRVHEPPSREKLVALKDYLATFDRKFALGQVVTPGLFNRMLKDVADESEKALIMEAVLRSQTQAYYGPRNAGHFGLAQGSYAHFTSPIRRYADLLVHRALVDGFGLEQPRPIGDLPPSSGLSERDRADLTRVSEAISAAERRAMEAERETIDRYVAAWLSARVGEVFECRITGVQRFGLFATIIGLGGDGLVPVSVLGDERFFHDEKAQALNGEQSGDRFTLGMILRLRLAEANPLTGALKFEPEAAEGRIEPRGKPLPLKKKGKHFASPRGRPGNIRHQGKRR
ncbi:MULTISPECIES: VacB/RNase II family 3'-5' exoribonuclease [unclassified Novosphingobium]|uniref:ribonuclease R family protein n=1 Tax=unclassified Novosphingobium TaxID=2644732 RepID=UPI0025F1513D|nr:MULTISPECIES: VacB/RNase II family 3'-5' exoribonuclease [unclassified Novosphingobium]HQV02730.1 VacB/RNase II family 3'-5' exoribonuclease [Novosphingobium sp.]